MLKRAVYVMNHRWHYPYFALAGAAWNVLAGG